MMMMMMMAMMMMMTMMIMTMMKYFIKTYFYPLQMSEIFNIASLQHITGKI